MENKSNIDSAQGNRNDQNTTSNSGLNGQELGQAQTESKYDSHSEDKPRQKTVVVTDAKPDRVSHDNRDSTSSKITNEDYENDMTDEGTEDDDLENYPNSENNSDKELPNYQENPNPNEDGFLLFPKN